MAHYRSGEEMRAFVARRMRADHHRYEQMARRVRNPGRVGCWTGAAEGGLMEGIALNVYRPRNPALPPVLAFGNTRLPEELTNIEQLGEFVSDLRADFDALEIGGYRWALNDGRIKGLLDSLTGEFGRKVVLTGHSLGGTLAQITACHYWPQVHSVVTFQSPRIGHSFARLARHLAAATVDDPSSRSFHYQMEQDEIITEAGYVLSPGFRIQFRWTPSIVIAMAHAAAALVQQLVRLLPEAGEIASIIIAVLREIGESIEWAVQNYLAHTVHFFEPYVEVADPSQIDPSDLSAQYEHIREDPTDRRLPAAANATEWIRQRAPLLTGGLASLALTGGVFPSPALIAVERMRRSVYVLIWEHLKDTIDADIARGRRPRRDLAHLRFPLRQVHAGLQLLPFDAVRVVTEREHEQIRQNLAWVYPEHFARGRSGPIVPGPLVPPPPAPRQALVDEEGRLTDAGWALVEADAERGDRTRPQMDALLNGYYTGAQAQGPSGRADRGSYWLEKLTAAEAALQFAATPVAESDPRILAGRQPGGGAVIIASGKALGALFTFLAGRAGRRLLALPPEVLQRHGELRAWSVMRVLVEGIRRAQTRDEELERAYYTAHGFYLSCAKSDPLALIAPARLRSLCCSVTAAPFSLDEFEYFAWRYRQLRFRDRDAERQLRQGRAPRSEAAQATLAQATGPWTWFNFLFKSEPHGEGAFSGQGFVAAETAAVRPCVDRSGTCNGPLEDEEAPAASGQTTVKALRSKRPDLVQIFADERRIEVLDPSFRWHEAWHNFKTQFYCAVLRLAFPGWQVAGLDYRDARRNRLA